VTTNGVFRPFALLDGRAVATWRLERGGPALEPFAPLDEAAFADERRDVVRFLGR
jgi:hypothetical protein